jgi:hypothetical protein
MTKWNIQILSHADVYVQIGDDAQPYSCLKCHRPFIVLEADSFDEHGDPDKMSPGRPNYCPFCGVKKGEDEI